MALIAYSEFVTRVKRQVWPDNDTHLEPINAAFPHDTFIRNALIQAQTYVECLRQNNVNTYTLEDATVNCGVAVIDAPDHIRVGAIYAYKPAKGCTRQSYFQQSVNEIMCYVDRYATCECNTESDICNSVRSGEAVCDELALCDDWTGTESDASWLCDDKIFAVGKAGRIYIAPRMPCDYRLAVHWEGVKYRYADTDLISDDPDLLDIVSTFVQAERARTFDRDLPLYQELLGKGPTQRGKGGSAWHMKIAAMNHRCREERRIRVRPCLEMWDDSAVSSENIGAQLDPVPSRDETGITFVADCVAQVCPEGSYVLNGECVACVTPTVTISANSNSILTGASVTLSWTNTVPALNSSVVTLEYGLTDLTLANNGSGTVVLTPAESETYLIRAATVCGTVVATVGIAVNDPCLCPDGLPDCLELVGVDPNNFPTCAPFNVGSWPGSTLWDGRLPLIEPCKWGIMLGTEVDGSDSFHVNSGFVQFQIQFIVELVSCNPNVYEMTMYFRAASGLASIFWQGHSQNNPVGTYISLNHDDLSPDPDYCFPDTDFAVIGCFDTPCTPPTIRFDPPAGARVSLPSVVFIHSTNDDDLIYYSMDGGTEFLPYTGAIPLSTGQTLHAKSVTLAGCPSVVTNSNYIAETDDLLFDFLCDDVDQAGVFYAFYANGSNDYHWRIDITRTLPWEFKRATIYETNAAGLWVTGQAWSTVSQIYPVEITPAAFNVYPLVLTDGELSPVVFNIEYAEPVIASVPAGNMVFHGYGQPFIALTGYFRLEMVINQGAGDFTLYKLIPHTCSPEGGCSPVVAPTATVDCDLEALITGTVTAGASYRIRRTGCNNNVFAEVSAGISLTGNISYLETVTAGCEYSYILSVYCVSTGEWVDSAATVMEAPSAVECACAAANCPELLDTYYLQSLSALQEPVRQCGGFGDCDDFDDPSTVWDQSYSRANDLCVWSAPAGRTYDGTYTVNSVIIRVVGDPCYWEVRFTCGDSGVVYRKTVGNSAIGTYEKFSDTCSDSFFPDQITIVEVVPD